MRAIWTASIATGIALAIVPTAVHAGVVGPPGVTSPEQEAPAQKQPRKNIYDESADAKEQIAAALARAKKENRRVLIQWGANWCGWCHLLHDCFEKNGDVRRKLLYEYEVVLVDIGRWDKNLDLAERYGAGFRENGVPYLTILDSEGKALANQETGSLEKAIDGKPGHDPEAVLSFLTKHQAEYLPAKSILSSALAKAKEKGKRLFLHFGAPWCGWCHRLEAWTARADVAEILGKDFIDVKIDIDRTIGGNEVMARFRKDPKSGGIPWFVFIDAEGKAIGTSDGPDGNLGCPYTDEEIAAFGELLERAAVTISAAEIDQLRNSLVKAREKKKLAE
jgi:thioredoxin-related protein